MKASALREQTEDELRQLLVDTQRDLFEMRMHLGTAEGGEQPVRMRLLRREIARIKTVMRERERTGDS